MPMTDLQLLDRMRQKARTLQGLMLREVYDKVLHVRGARKNTVAQLHQLVREWEKREEEKQSWTPPTSSPW